MSDYNVYDMYSSNAEAYAINWFKTWRIYTEVYTIMKNVLDQDNFTPTSFENKCILDMGCGGGNYIRHFLKCGAKRAVGIDLTPEFIQVANRLTKEPEYDSSRFSFYQANCSSLPEVIESLKNEPIKKFDIVISTWVLNHASSIEELNSMLEVASHLTRADGTFISILVNARSFYNPDEDFEYTRQYGFILERCMEESSVNKRRVTFIDPDTGDYLFEVYDVLYNMQDLISAFNRNMFIRTEEVSIEVEPNHILEIDPIYLENIRNPMKSYVMCLKAKKMDIP